MFKKSKTFYTFISLYVDHDEINISVSLFLGNVTEKDEVLGFFQHPLLIKKLYYFVCLASSEGS